MITALIISSIALLVGPAILSLERGRLHVMRLLDGFVIVTIGAMMLLHVLPESLGVAGWIAVPAALLGLVLPALAEKLGFQSAEQSHQLALTLATLALVGHTFVDGVAIGYQASQSDLWLVAAILLHRFPVGMVTWMLLKREWSARAALLVLLAMIGMTWVGAFSAGTLPFLESSVLIAMFQAFVAGSLLHVLLHEPHAHHDGHHHGHGHDHHHDNARSPSERFAELFGAALGGALVWGISRADAAANISHGTLGGHSHHSAFHHGIGEFVEVAIEWMLLIAPLYLCGLALSELMTLLMQRVEPGRTLSRIGAAIGETTCTCGAVHAYQSQARERSRFAEVDLYLATFLSGTMLVPAFGLVDASFVTVLLLVGGACAGCIAIWRRLGTSKTPSPTVERSHAVDGESSSLARTFLRLDRDAPWLLASTAVASSMMIGGLDGLLVLSPAAQLVFFFIVGWPLYVPGSAAAILAAALLAVGISPGAVLTFAITASTLHISVVRVLVDARGSRQAVIYVAICSGIAVVGGLALDAALPILDGTWGPAFADMISSHGDHLTLDVEPAVKRTIGWAASALLVVGLGLSLARNGVREWLTTMLNGDHAEGTHAHHHQN